MKNRLKEFRMKRKMTPSALAKNMGFNGVNFTKQQVLDAEKGTREGFNLDLLFKASGRLKVPFHKLLDIPIEGYADIARKGDPCCLDCAVCFVLEGWFDISDEWPDLKKIGKWALRTYRATVRFGLNFQEQRDYGHKIVRPGFDSKPFKTLRKLSRFERLKRSMLLKEQFALEIKSAHA